ncbi:hypothetical protein FB45DRAFT_811698 [Roridomyces roridus]|uniref:F-box domain-containing protein n=1 Tax=Roridomyces roridus TaxID=1738132 RepID=A0AAD7AXY1_9AGAR|nr:hypothetical protein FB45DRAFT_811698 [Roridomyces roridus]
MEANYPALLPDFPAAPISIAHLTTSNHGVPSDLESRLAKAHIHELESQLVSVQNLIALSLERAAQLERAIEAHKSIISPIRRLPNELLAEIFSQASQAAFYWDDISTSPVTSQAPWLFTHVCRLWAGVALGTRPLWSQISMRLHCIDEEARGVASMVKLFLERSGSLPLIVDICNEDNQLKTHRSFDASVTHVQRWEDVDLFVECRLLLFIAAAIRGQLCTLKTLRIWSCDKDGMGAGDLSDAFAIAPNLTALEAAFHSGDNTLRSPFEFPWHQLTRLLTTFSSNAEALTVLEQLSSIVELQVEFSSSGESIALARNFVTLPHLRVLEIMLQDMYFMSLGPLSYLLEFTAAPSLEHLGIQGMADQGSVSRFVTRSGCAPSLKTLHFIHKVTTKSILPIPRNLPYLEDLVIGDFGGELDVESEVVDTLLSHWHSVCATSDARLPVKLVDSQRTDSSFVPAIQEVDGLHISFDESLFIDSIVESRFKLHRRF